MPKIIFNGLSYGSGIGGGGNANFVELTKAEYDTLEAAGEVKADTLYFIIDADAEGVEVGETDISKIGDGTITGAIGLISTYNISTSYGTINVAKCGRMVMISGNLSGIPTGAWTTITTELPHPVLSQRWVGQNTDAWSDVAMLLELDGVLKFFGRNESPQVFLGYSYITSS